MKTVFLVSKDSWVVPFIKKYIKNKSSKELRLKIRYSENRMEKADICFIVGFYKIVKNSTLKKFKTCVVIHESNLPTGRGWSPLSWQIEEGKNKIPICLIEAKDKIDSGAIFLKDYIEFNGNELLLDIKLKQWEKTKDLIEKFIKNYPHILKLGIKQNGKPTYYRKRTDKDNELNPYKTIAEQFNKLRVSDNEKFPAWFTFKGKKYILKIFYGG